MKKGNSVSSKSSKNKFASQIPILNNIILLVLFAILIKFSLNNISGYKWLHTKLIKGNLVTIKKYKDLTFDQKLEAKLGHNLVYLNFLKKNTPDDAIILMPPSDIALKKSNKFQFTKFILNKVWVTNFIYPRRVVYESEKENSALYDSVTYVAIINGWGYHKVNFEVTGKHELTVLKIEK